MGKNDDSGDDASPSQSSTAPGRGKLEQLHKKELKDLRDKSKNELKKTKDKERKREIEARYRTMEDELVAAFKEKFRLLAEAPLVPGDVVEKPAATTNKQVNEDLQQAGDSGHDRIAAGVSGGTPAEPPPEKAVLATIDVGAADDQDDERDASPTKTEGGGALTEEEKIARKRAKKQRQRDNKEQKKKEEDEKRAKIVEEMGTPLSALENERMEKQLKKEGMKLFDIPSDGNCLFRAVHHQLKFIDHPAAAATGAENGKIKTYDDLRHLTADTLEKNRDEYEAFLLAEAEETGESWEGYVEKIRNGPLWGGYTELSALAKALESRILVYQGEGDRVLEFGADDADWELRISYHKFLYTSAHYNSLLPA
eukprot:g16116.t1